MKTPKNLENVLFLQHNFSQLINAHVFRLTRKVREVFELSKLLFFCHYPLHSSWRCHDNHPEVFPKELRQYFALEKIEKKMTPAVLSMQSCTTAFHVPYSRSSRLALAGLYEGMPILSRATNATVLVLSGFKLALGRLWRHLTSSTDQLISDYHTFEVYRHCHVLRISCKNRIYHIFLVIARLTRILSQLIDCTIAWAWGRTMFAHARSQRSQNQANNAQLLCLLWIYGYGWGTCHHNASRASTKNGWKRMPRKTPNDLDFRHNEKNTFLSYMADLQQTPTCF